MTICIVKRVIIGRNYPPQPTHQQKQPNLLTVLMNIITLHLFCL